MRAQPTKLLGLIAAAVVTAGILLAWLCLPGRQPTHEGKPIADWFCQLPEMLAQPAPQPGVVVVDVSGASALGGGPSPAGASLRAIRSLGTNGLPYLFRKLTQHESPIRNWVRRWVRKVGVKQVQFVNVGRERSQAVTALTVLSPLPPKWVDQLRRLSTDRDTNVALAAQCLLLKKDDSAAKSLLGVFP